MLFEYFSCLNLEEVSLESIKDLNKFYLPLIGAEGFSLYSFLAFHSEKQERFSFFGISKFLNLSPEKLRLAKDKLEACGLVRTSASEEQQHAILELALPCDYENFKKNPMLLQLLEYKLGNEMFQELISRWTIFPLRLSKDYHECSSSLFEVFGDEIKTIFKSQKKQNLSSTLELSLEAIEKMSVTEAITNLSPEKFYNYLTKRISPAALTHWVTASKNTFNKVSINHIIHYTFWKLGEIPIAYLRVLSDDLIAQKLVSIDNVKKHFQKIIKRQKSKSLNNKSDTSNIPVNSTISEIDFEDLFRD